MPKLCLLLCLLPLAQICGGVFAPPEGLDFCATARVDEVRFLVDECWVDNAGRRHVRQEIFRELRELIRRADEFLVLDMFLVNNFGYEEAEGYYPLSDEFTEWLVAKRRDRPEVDIILISDPVNTVYGSIRSPHFEQLRKAGVSVVITDLDELPDSNPVYSTPWRLSAGLLGTGPGCALPNPMGEGRVSVRSFLQLLNMKANHRKTALSEKEIMVMSANPHSGSSAHWNTALHVKGGGMSMLWQSEEAVLRFSGMQAIPERKFHEKPGEKFQVELLTEAKIRDRVVELLANVEEGGRVDLSMFYFSDDVVFDALLKAHRRGCLVRVILDANKDAFGREKNGTPNRQTAASLRESGVPVRWARTSGEQFHVKMLYVEQLSGAATLVTGSANYTRRNLANINAESCLAVTGSVDSELMAKPRRTFERWWQNEPERIYTVNYSVYSDENPLRRVIVWFQEISGFSSF